jgi:basic membrane protein A and related proteins
MLTRSRREFVKMLSAAVAIPAADLLVSGNALAAAPVKIALLLPGSVADGGWNMLAYQGLQALKAQGFKVSYTESVTDAQMEQTIRGYADAGYDLIIGHSYEYGAAFDEIAPSYPTAKFFASTFKPAGAAPGNVEFVNLDYIEAAYGAGALAALISEKGRAVGFVGGGDNPTQNGMMHAFTLGAEQARPGVKGLGLITGDYDNAAKGREAVTVLTGNGADVIFHAADITGLGAIQGAAAAGVKAIGCYGNQAAIAPNSIATSFELNLPWIVETTAHTVKGSGFLGGQEWRPAPAKTWLQVYNAAPYNAKLVSAAQWAAFQAIWQNVNTGKIDVQALIAA